MTEGTQSIIKCSFCGYTFDQLAVPEIAMGYIECPQCHHQLDQYGVDYGKRLSGEPLPQMYYNNFLLRIV